MTHARARVRATEPASSPVVTPVAPFQIQTTSVMSQDVVNTASVTLASLAVTPVAPFVNPQANGVAGNAQLEALVVAAPGQGGATVNTLGHVMRDSGTDGGWTVVTLFGGRAVSGVAAGTAYASTATPGVYAVFQDDPSVTSPGVWWTQLAPSSATWSDPTQLFSGTLDNLRATYGPEGALVVYGVNASGDLVAIYQTSIGGAFTSTTFQTNGALAGADPALTITDSMNGFNALAVVNGTLTQITGTLTEAAVTTNTPSVSGTYTGVVLGYWSSAQRAVVYLLVDSAGALSIWVGSGGSTQTVPISIPNSVVTSATGVTTGAAGNPLLHIYSIDDDNGLWVLHQDPDLPWNEDGTPNFAPYIPLDSGIAGVIADGNPVDAATLFAWDGDFGLRLHAQDPVTSMWSSALVQQSAQQTFEIVRFRTEVTLLDANAIPVPSYPITLQVAPSYSAADVWVAGQTVAVGSGAPVTFSTDTNGKLTFAIMTTAGMVAPNMLVAADQLAATTLSPAAPVHTYLSGSGTLNPTNPGGALPVFDSAGTTLTAAQSDGAPLAPLLQPNQNPPSNLASIAASNIQTVAQVGLNPGGASFAGFAGSLDRRAPRFEILRTPEELAARLAARAAPESFLDDLKEWAGDVWNGIKNGVIKIGDYIADAANSVVNFFVKIGDEIEGWVQLAIEGLEQAASFIAGVFQAIEADVDRVIDWLKALFDFAAIWRTQQAFATALTSGPAYLQGLVTFAQNATNGWFSQQIDSVNAYFTKLQGQYGASDTMSTLPGWQTPGQPPSTTPAMGNAAPSDVSNNAHHNWLQDKFQSYAPQNPSVPTTSMGSLSTLLGSVGAGGSANSAVQDFQAAFDDFKAGISSVLSDPSSFSTVGISDFLGAANKLVQALLALADDLVVDLLAFASDALGAIATVFATELDLGIFNGIWSWIAEKAGVTSPPAPTVGGVLALLGAFPTTVIYKLALGVDNEPFPPQNADAAAASIFNSLGVQCEQAGAILQAIYALPAVIGDIWGATAPGWLSLLKGAWVFVVFFLIHGTPDLTGLEWGAVGAMLLLAAFAAYIIQSLLNFARFFAGDTAVDNAVNDVLAVLFTVYGAGMLVLGIALDFVETSSAYDIAARFLLPLPSVFALFSTTAMREFVAVQVVVDLVGYIGGGIAEYFEYSSTSSAAVPATTGAAS